jgi:DinB family protein
MPELNTATLDKMVTDFFLNGRQPSLSIIVKPFSADDLIHAFENLRRSMTRLLNGLNEAQINFSPDANTYSLSEIVSHLSAAQGLTYNAFLDIASSTLPHVDPVPRNPGGGAEKGLDGQILQTRLQKATDDLIGALRNAYSPLMEKEVQHPFLGSLTLRGWMLFQLTHDLDHLKQAQTVRRSTSFPRKLE